jgi:hypothetical protein
LLQISALPDGSYELVFEAGKDRHRFICEVGEHRGIQFVNSRPSLTVMDPESDEPDVGDPRPVVEAVLAMHRARGADGGQRPSRPPT